MSHRVTTTIILAVWITTLFWNGGVGDLAYPLIYTSMATLSLVYFWSLRRGELRLPAWRLVVAWLTLMGLQLLPLPSSLVDWLSLHGATVRAALATPATLAGEGSGWRCIAVDRFTLLDTFLHGWLYLLTFWLAGLVFENEDHRQRFAKTFLAGAVLLALLGISQRLGLWQWRGYAALVNRNHVATFLVAALPLALSGFLFSLQWRRRGWYGAAFLVISLAAIFSQARLGIVGTIFSLAVTLAVWAWVAKQTQLPKAKLAFGLAIGLIATLIFYILMVMGTHDIQAIFDRLQGGELIRGYRWQLWRDALAAWMQAPLLGHGAGSFSQVIHGFRSYQGYLRAEHADNEFLEILVTTGAVGLVLTLLAGWALIRRLRQIGPRRDWIFVAAIASLGVMPLAAAVNFIFEVPAVMMLMALLLGMIYPANEAKLQLDPEQRRWHALTVNALLLVTLISIPTVVMLRNQQRLEGQLLEVEFSGNHLEAKAEWLAKLADLETYTARHPWDDRGHKLLGWALMQTQESQEESRRALDRAWHLNPFDPATLHGLAQHSLRLGEHAKAEEQLQQSLNLSDQVQAKAQAAIHYQLAKLKLRDGRLEGAESSLNLFQSRGGSAVESDWLRVESYLARQEWGAASSYSERTLNQDPAYLEPLIGLWLKQESLPANLLRPYLNQLILSAGELTQSLERAAQVIPPATVQRLWGDRLFVTLPMRGSDDYQVTLAHLESEASVVAAQQSRWDDKWQDWIYTLDTRYPTSQQFTDWWGLKPQLPVRLRGAPAQLQAEVLVRAPYRLRNQFRVELQSALGKESFTTARVLPLGEQWYALEIPLVAPEGKGEVERTLESLGFNTGRIAGRYQLTSFRLSIK